jgi:ankyrin repeat protein
MNSLGADVNNFGGRHDTAIMAAASLGMLDLVRKLIDCGAKVNDENDKGSDALYAACTGGHLDVVELLLASGADVNAKGKFIQFWWSDVSSDFLKAVSIEMP